MSLSPDSAHDRDAHHPAKRRRLPSDAAYGNSSDPRAHGFPPIQPARSTNGLSRSQSSSTAGSPTNSVSLSVTTMHDDISGLGRDHHQQHHQMGMGAGEPPSPSSTSQIPPGHIPKRGARACTACRKGKNRCEGEVRSVSMSESVHPASPASRPPRPPR